jgi:hypothetical protein
MNEDKGDCICNECNGSGVTLIREIKLYEICKKCNGDTKFTWLEKALGKNNKYYDSLLSENMYKLITETKEYAFRAGYQIDFSIHPRVDPYQYYNYKDIIGK